MVRMAFRGLFARKLRTALTGFAVVIGVAFVSGTFIFTDTINASFTDLFERVSKGVDVNVTAKQPVEGDFGGRIQPLPDGTLEKVEAVPGRRGGRGQLRDRRLDLRRDTRARRRQRPAVDRLLRQRGALRPATPTSTAARPSSPAQVTIDEATADRRASRSATRSWSAGREPAQELRDLGITKIGDQDSIGIRAITMPLVGGAEDRRRSRARSPRSSSRPRAARARSSSRRAIAQALGDTAVVRTGKEQAEESAGDINDSLGFLKIALLVFAGVAVLVGGFLIFNTFAVTVAQRSREFALLRTLGASRRQVLNSVIAETLVIGFVASVLGILGGLLLAPGPARRCWPRSGIELPSTGTVIAPRTVIVGLAGRHDRHARLRPRAGAPRDAGRAGRGDARRVDAPARARVSRKRLIISPR